MNYWLMKSEPDDVSIDDLAARPDQTVGWYGVRNYQARNFMRDEMQLGDQVFFYHSSCKEPGIAGLATVCRMAYPDPTQFDPKSKYFDAKSTPDKPRWLQVDVRFVQKTRLLSLNQLRSFPELCEMVLLQKGSRLSITPVSDADAAFILGKLC
ncbi:EVE domain-containing protein [Iodobacter sp. HSC-16F04]|uniref:EVE domain-containing protein n=1 Tax=Iodobacter violaceini TaxID=3044271 RepID=A0ABX0KY59_9NEIS|nr:EVE domain-containing protein [Iodobacter violacea]NHQ87345.1 EVE domain-containing protein [Iodobacter violacea]